MSKRTVFLYCTQKDKEYLLQYERVIRALLRKFRQSPLFSYLQIDTSLSCRDGMCDLLRTGTARRGAIFLESSSQNISECMAMLDSVFMVRAASHHISGRTICYAEQKLSAASDDKAFHCTNSCEKESIRAATEISIMAMENQKHALSICLNPESKLDNLFLQEIEVLLGGKSHIQAECIPLDAMISKCLKTVPEIDVVLTTKDYASLIAMHLNAMPKIPSGYIVSYGESRNVYRRQIISGEDAGNLHHLSSLFAIAAIFENEFEMKSAADWLRRALSLAFLKEASSSCTDFISAVIKEIETPIRKQRT